MTDYPTPRTDAAYKACVNGVCLPKCDSYGHEELCPYVNGENVMAEFARQLERELAEAKAALAACQKLLDQHRYDHRPGRG